MTTADQVLDALRPYELKEEKPGHYRCNSPLRPGSNSRAFALTIHDGEHGAFHDFVSGEKGSLYQLATKIGVALPLRAPIADTKRPYSGIEDYATAHGISAAVLHTAGWREVTYEDRFALEFTTTTGKRWRFLDGQKPHYKSERGYKRCWYGLNSTWFERLRTGAALVICNGRLR